METVQIVLDKDLLRATDQAARRTKQNRSAFAVNMHNAVTIAQDRLGKRVARLSSSRMNEICAALHFSLGCDLYEAQSIQDM